MAAVDNSFLEQKLTLLKQARHWSPRLLSKLARQIRDGEDSDLFRMSPVRFASSHNIDRHEAIDLFLYAARHEIFSIDWLLVCPVCGQSIESLRSLRNVHVSFHCNMCRIDTEATLDELILVAFTVMPQVRSIRYHSPDSLDPFDYYYGYVFYSEAQLPEPDPRTGSTSQLEKNINYTRATIDLAVRERKTIQVSNPEPGWMVIMDVPNNSGSVCEIVAGTSDAPGSGTGPSVDGGSNGGSAAAMAVVLERGSGFRSHSAVPIGQVEVTLKNQTGTRSRVLVFVEPADSASPRLVFPLAVTGKEIINTQVFRTLFGSEVISGTDGLNVRDITLLFTDLKGSTALYDRIGDLRAFTLVREHFDQLARVIADNHGAVVKTMGDAIMASFVSPESAVRSGLEMIRAIEEFNVSRRSKDLSIKIGIHRGATIAVTMNDRLDYFGQMVNIASRVQALAGASEICVTEEIHSAAGIRPLLAGTRIMKETFQPRGIREEVPVYRIRPRRARTKSAASSASTPA